MLKNVFKKQNPVASVKCVKCGKKNATGEDNMCNSCRYLLTIGNIIDSRK